MPTSRTVRERIIAAEVAKLERRRRATRAPMPGVPPDGGKPVQRPTTVIVARAKTP